MWKHGLMTKKYVKNRKKKQKVYNINKLNYEKQFS